VFALNEALLQLQPKVFESDEGDDEQVDQALRVDEVNDILADLFVLLGGVHWILQDEQQVRE